MNADSTVRITTTNAQHAGACDTGEFASPASKLFVDGRMWLCADAAPMGVRPIETRGSSASSRAESPAKSWKDKNRSRTRFHPFAVHVIVAGVKC